MQSTTVVNEMKRAGAQQQHGSHQYASAASAQPPRPIPAYVTPSETPSRANSSSPERRLSASPKRRRRIGPVNSLEQVPYCRVDYVGDANRTRVGNGTNGFARDAHQLIIRQQPGIGKVFVGKEKDRKPIDPPPVVQLVLDDRWDQQRRYLHSPYYFMSTSLVDDLGNASTSLEASSGLGGTLVSSLHKVKDLNGAGDVAFFVFGDLSVKLEGFFKLKFTLFEVRGKEVEYIKDVTSEPFQVYSGKTWPGMGESTALTRMLSDQGIRLRLRKEPRFRVHPDGPASDDYVPKRYAARRSKSVMEPGQDPRRESGASAMTEMGPTPGGQEGGADAQSPDDVVEEQQHQQQFIQPQGPQSPISPIAPQPIAPMASFIVQENRKRELSMSSYNSGTPATAGGVGVGVGAGVPSHNEPMPKRSRLDEEPNQPAMYGHYPTPQSMEQQRLEHYRNQEALQMYPPGQLGPPAQATQFGRQSSYSHGPQQYMGNRGPVNYDFNEREAVSMSPAQYRPQMLMGQEQQFQQRGMPSMYENRPVQQSLLKNPDFPVQQSIYQQFMAQQQARMRSVSNRGMMEQNYEYNSPPDPTIDPLLAAQSVQQRPQQGMMPRMSVPVMGGGQPPQYYGQRAGGNIPSPDPMMHTGNIGMQNAPTPEMAGTQQFYGNMAAGQVIGMRGMQPSPQDGIGFRGGMPGQLAPQDGVGFRPASAQDGVGFRDPNQFASPIPSHHSGDTTIVGEVGDMGHGHPN